MEEKTHYALYKSNSSYLIEVVRKENIGQVIGGLIIGEEYLPIPASTSEAKELVRELKNKKNLTRRITDEDIFLNPMVA